MERGGNGDGVEEMIDPADYSIECDTRGLLQCRRSGCRRTAIHRLKREKLAPGAGAVTFFGCGLLHVVLLEFAIEGGFADAQQASRG